MRETENAGRTIERMRRSRRHRQVSESQIKKNQCLDWESKPDRQICALLIKLSRNLVHIIQSHFHVAATSVATATFPSVAVQTLRGYLRQILGKRFSCPEESYPCD